MRKSALPCPSASSRACWAAGSCPAPSCWSAATRASANPPCCCRWPWRWPPGARCCMSPAKNPSARSRCAPCACCGNGKEENGAHPRKPAAGHRDQPGYHPGARRPRSNPTFLIVDSIQTVYLPELDFLGRVGRRRCASAPRGCASWPNPAGIAVFLIGHVTKEGVIAGPRVLEHIVDTVLYLEGDRFQSYRLLRSVKNRFGATAEVGVFEMRENGMIEVTNPSEAFLAERMVNAPGQRHRGNHGRHPPAAGGNPGADQPLQPGQPAPHPQRGGFQPPAARSRPCSPAGRDLKI